MLAQAIRDRIVRHPDFGAGNFPDIACELVPDPNRPYLTVDGPRDAVGAAYVLPRALSLNDIRRLSAYPYTTMYDPHDATRRVVSAAR